MMKAFNERLLMDYFAKIVEETIIINTLKLIGIIIIETFFI